MQPLVITSGEPAGIGPDICLQLAARPARHQAVVLCDPDLLQARARAMGLNIDIFTWTPGQPAPFGDGELCVLPVACAEPVQCGQLDPANSRYVLSLLDRAVDGIEAGHFNAMVTAPVQKSVISDAGIAFSGHTEYLQQRAGVDQVVMMLATEGLMVALVTTHLPLRAVPDAITRELVQRVARVLNDSLQFRFGLHSPRILVCGLNPHAGEGGHMGQEEIDTLIPALDELRAEGLQLIGPLPADTLFTDKVLARGDVALAMYHDQGLPVLKYKGFGDAVNITLGLPFIRTSVDHGTALDLAGTGQANPGSLETAMQYAMTMAYHSSQASGRSPSAQAPH
ncbi:4-hydroxythreonine-4-phosphate dehydrogenase PdxA [Natronospirillum operosum]|uniref:4-hydroxythreonine-4-phosphate dehydrogenase n=1 Tax=Natronospirillum operosum TaxID=2759953 RepID=A0A4Z0WB39_9GAMM|nr:4-hydroxythreonine-4-phosphate dehydrogenase PdxA [Natronospirillum operosum]TGG94954.1 4-hydroxythreonine-4-phosphate dehydrogenase PdxA [Natronospirillum operosum]